MGGTKKLNCIAPVWVLSMELDLDLRPELDSKTKKTCQCSLRRSMVCVWMCVTRKWYLFFVRANWDCRYWLNPEPVQNGLTRQHITKYPLTNGWYEVLKKLQTVQTPGNMHHIHCVQIFTQICKKSEMMIADDSQTSDLDLMPVSKYRSTLNFLLNKANIHFKELRASPRFHSQAAWGEISPAELWKESFLLSWNISKMR